MKKPAPPRDTPVDTPAIIAAPDLPPNVVAPRGADLGPEAGALGARALARVQLETLEGAYTAWRELLAAYDVARKRWADERARLEAQGALLLGAVRAATHAPGSSEAGLLKLDGFLGEATAQLEASKAELEARTAAAETAFLAELARLRTGLIERVARQAATVRPAFRLAVRVLGAEERILHAHRLGDDDAVVALFALTSRIPSRYGYLADDATDDVTQAPPSLYLDEGNAEVRPTAASLTAQLDARQDVWPVKGVLPLKLPGGVWTRWIARGAVLEAEVLHGERFRNVLTRTEAEQLTGVLLAAKLAGRVELELVRD